MHRLATMATGKRQGKQHGEHAEVQMQAEGSVMHPA